MKILLVNYHYFINGGPDRYFFNIKSALEDAGHEVIPFCFNYDETLETKYRRYFPDPITGKGPCLLAQQKLTKVTKIKALARMFYNRQVNNKFRQIIRIEKPDIVYSVYLSSTLLPNILKIAKKEFSLPVVYRLSDFHMFCPAYLFCRDGQVCKECIHGLKACIKHRCVKDSKVMSLARVAQMRFIRVLNYYKYVDRFVTPSSFTRDMMIEQGFDSAKVVHISTFAKDMLNAVDRSDLVKKDRILFLGNLSKEKGVDVLLKAYCKSKTSMPLEILGKGDIDFINELKAIVPDAKKDRVNFRGFISGDELNNYINRTAFMVHPVVWYENMPNSVVEIMSLKKTVIASDIGSMPELVKHEKNGFLVPPGDLDALAVAIDKMAFDSDLNEFGRHSRQIFEKNHTEEKHMQKLLKLFESL